MIEEYEEKVEPTVKAYGKFLNEAFIKNLSVVDTKVRQEALDKAEAHLASLYFSNEAKFDEYLALIERHEELDDQIKLLNTELRRTFGSDDTARLEADRQYLENRVTAGRGVETDNQTTFEAETQRLRSTTIFSREGWDNRISALRNFFSLSGYKSDAEIAETNRYGESRDVLAERILQLNERQEVIGEGIEQKNQLLGDIEGVREELLEAMDLAGEMRQVLLVGLKQAMTRGVDYDPSKAGETIGSLDAMWDESDSDGTPEYDKFRDEINKKLKAAFKLIVNQQTDSATGAPNSRMLQEFGTFVNNSVQTQETKDIVEKELESAIEKQRNPAKKAHLAMMMRRVQSKEF